MAEPQRQYPFWYCLTLALAMSLAAIGVVILYDSLSASDTTGRIALRPGGGAIAILISIGFAAVASRQRHLATLAATVVAALAVALVVVPALPAFAASTDIQHVRISPVLMVAVCLMALSIAAAVFLHRGRMVGLVSAPLVLMIGLLSLLSHWFPPLKFASLGSAPESTIVVSPLVMLCSLVLPFLFAVFHQPAPPISRSLLLAGALGIAITTSSWHTMRLQHSDYARQRAEVLAAQLETSGTSAYASRLALIQRLAERYRLVEGVPSPAFWHHEVSSYLRDFPEIHLLTVLDPLFQPIQTETRSLEQRAWLSSFLEQPKSRAWLSHVIETKTAHLSHPLVSDAGTPYAAIAMPVSPIPGQFWLVLAAIDLGHIYERLLQHYEGDLGLLVNFDGRVVFNSARGSTPGSRTVLATSDVNPHHDNQWRVEVFALNSAIPADELYLPPLVLFTGISLSFLVMLSLLYWRESERRSIHLTALNTALNYHLEEERGLRYTNERIMEFSRDILCSISPDGLFRFVSPACESVLGYTPDELTGQHFDRILAPADRRQTIEEVRRLSAGELDKAQGFQTRLVHRDGHVVTVSWTAEWSNKDRTLFGVGRDITDTLVAEALAREREQFFSLSPDMFCIVDLKAHFFEVNQAFVETLGYSRDELLGRSYFDLIHTDDWPTAEAAVRSLVAGGAVRDLDLRTLHKEGGLRWLSINAIVSADELIYVAARDTTDVRRTREKLQESEALLRMAERVARIGGWIVDLSTGQTVWSDAVCDIHDVPRGKAPGVEDAIGYYIPEHRSRIADAVDLCAQTGIPFDEELQIRTAKGRLRWVRTIGHAVKGGDGQIVKLQGAFQDITATRQAMEQIRRYTERQATIFESITDAFFTLDRDWRFIYLNSRSEELLQKTRDELLGRTVWESFPEAIGSEFEEQYHRAVTTGQAVTFEAFFLPLDTWFEVSAYPSDEGLAVYYRSINERKKAQQLLESTLEELERSNKDLQDFAFVASHDLQEPLRKIQAFSDRLLTRSDDFGEQEKDYLRRMQSAAERMQALILDLLSYSRVATKARPAELCDTNRILADVLQDMETSIARENATIETRPLPPVHGDATQIRQVLQNLLSNAIKFHQQDQSPRVLVYPENETPNGWTLAVKDDGVGFDPRYADKLFQPFQRLHQRQDYAGTGIGMAIVKKILDRHNATIAVDSAPDAGTTFHIRFSSTHQEN